MILGVSFGWGYYKGLDIFIRLANELGDDFQIVLVGTDDKVDKELPKNIISIHRTNNQKELAEIYSAADIFVSATREENYPTVHMEAIACGTPVITFDTGGCKEIVDPTTGVTVEKNNYEALKQAIIDFRAENKDYTEACMARRKAFDKSDKYQQYLDLYERKEF